MYILPAIDLYEGKAVRLYKGDYNRMTVYDDNPVNTALKFKEAGATWIHVVDLEGARDCGTPNKDVVKKVIEATGLKVEIGGGIRSLEIIEEYIKLGASRVILGTAAITNENLVEEATRLYGSRIAVGADIKEGYVAIKGWTEKTQFGLHDFCENMQKKGVQYIICTDISRDGALQGTNREMYKLLTEKFNIDFIASGGISSIDDISALRKMNIYGAIIGKAYYQGTIDLQEAIEEAK